VVVGCGTVVPEADRACSAYWFESGEVRALLDCGPGSLQAMVRLGLPWQDLTDLILTHFHADHTGAIPGLMFALKWALLPDRRSQPLDVHGPRGTLRFFEAAASAFGPFMLDPGFEVRVHEAGTGSSTHLSDEVLLRTHPTPHTEESRALRIDSPAASVVYTGDTGPSDSLAQFCTGSDLLVAECSLPDSLAIDTHLSPRSVARLATGAGPASLLLTHMYPRFRENADVARLIREAGWRGKVQLASEGWAQVFRP
jgi:ribonuclease BN (tRNA processing enzyme)